MKISRKFYRIVALAGAIIMPLGAVLAGGAPEASAASVAAQYCFASDCLNAWNGGPLVKVFTGGHTGTTNNYFAVTCVVSTGICQIQDAGVNQSDGLCIGDAGNNTGSANTGLVGCTGWGTNFREDISTCPPGAVAFYNVHWDGYLGLPNNAVNGSNWYLNKPLSEPFCFTSYL